jgi:hypothetical protein
LAGTIAVDEGLPAFTRDQVIDKYDVPVLVSVYVLWSDFTKKVRLISIDCSRFISRRWIPGQRNHVARRQFGAQTAAASMTRSCASPAAWRREQEFLAKAACNEKCLWASSTHGHFLGL